MLVEKMSPKAISAIECDKIALDYAITTNQDTVIKQSLDKMLFRDAVNVLHKAIANDTYTYAQQKNIRHKPTAVNTVDKESKTILHVAVQNEHAAIISELLTRYPELISIAVTLVVSTIPIPGIESSAFNLSCKVVFKKICQIRK